MDHSHTYKHLFHQFLKVAVSLCFVDLSLSVNFNRDYTGVAFLPFVRPKDSSGNSYSRDSYKPEYTRVMMRVIAKRFSRILTYGMGCSAETYVRNVTYYKDINAEGHTAEAAAFFNKENGHKTLRVIQGVWSANANLAKIEAQVALEAAEKANNFYPGTVEGIVFANDRISCVQEDVERILKLFRMVKNYSTTPNMLVGTVWKCGKLVNDLKDTQSGSDGQLFSTFVNESDFIICYLQNERSTAFEVLTKPLLQIRNEIKKVNPKISVMVTTMWALQKDDKEEDMNKFKSFWESMDEWATKNKFPVYIDIAIENPHRVGYGGHGWWKLNDSAKVMEISGYVEHFPEKDNGRSFTFIAVVICVTLSVIIGGVGSSCLVWKLKKACSRHCQVWANVIAEFEDGLENGNSPNGKNGIHCYEALKVPFDKSFELRDEQMCDEQRMEQIMQIGRICNLYRAEILSGNERLPVALKKTEYCALNDMKEILDEVKILIRIKGHPNIVTLHGISTKDIFVGKLTVALELCHIGSLDNYLKDHALSAVENISSISENQCAKGNTTTESITVHQMILWSHEIAAGMEYLESKHIILGCLSARNILLTSNKTAKITGFNLRRQIDETTKFLQTGLRPSMWPWLSIESLGKCEFSYKSDVWSFGVTLWEIFSKGGTPYAEISWSKSFVHKLENGLRLQNPVYGTSNICDIMNQCWFKELDVRPHFAELKGRINACMEGNKYHPIANVEIF